MTVFSTKTLSNGDIEILDGDVRAATLFVGSDMAAFNDDHIYLQPNPDAYRAEVNEALYRALLARDA